ncbi:hypothetical protein WSK_0734 [Novosphingobium sp. Rr 2-17]|uniref:RcnB family protein n=1 Tax=Novosphingobium sp. Rr 2-17 TaxID=555793 RepID=UPI0002697E5E|nr:RcnB family protein [Novosphingobium sp. Rr 2-17]EIZ80761.1 hypothetical protein WSK_0734 [Novosphingobium sp. Rr 2-17]
MKKFAAILLSAALVAPLATPTMAQPAQQSRDDRDDRGGPAKGRDQDRKGQAQGPNQGGEGRGSNQARGGRDQGPAGGYKSFRKGERFDSGRARNYQSVDYRRYKNLKAPPRGYRYVRSGNDVLLISAAGVVAAVSSGMFR